MAAFAAHHLQRVRCTAMHEMAFKPNALTRPVLLPINHAAKPRFFCIDCGWQLHLRCCVWWGHHPCALLAATHRVHDRTPAPQPLAAGPSVIRLVALTAAAYALQQRLR